MVCDDKVESWHLQDVDMKKHLSSQKLEKVGGIVKYRR